MIVELLGRDQLFDPKPNKIKLNKPDMDEERKMDNKVRCPFSLVVFFFFFLKQNTDEGAGVQIKI